MKVLHFSDVGLPDARVERPAVFSKHQGWEVVFAGGRSSQAQIFRAFDTIHYRYWKSSEKTGFPGTLQQVRNWLRRLIRTGRNNWFAFSWRAGTRPSAADVDPPFLLRDLLEAPQLWIEREKLIAHLVKKNSNWQFAFKKCKHITQ